MMHSDTATRFFDCIDGNNARNSRMEVLTTLASAAVDVGRSTPITLNSTYGQELEGRPRETIPELSNAYTKKSTRDLEPIHISMMVRRTGVNVPTTLRISSQIVPGYQSSGLS